MKTTILSASVEFIEQPFLHPLQLSSGLITQATEARATVTVRVGDREGTGHGSIYLSDLWAWPGATPNREAKDAAMRALSEKIASGLAEFCGSEAAHPLELGLRLHHRISQPDDVPLLARAVCASPFDAAIHDAAGQALEQSAFRFYDQDAPIPSADQWFSQGAIPAIRQTLRPPVDALDAWIVVGAKDDLETKIRPLAVTTGIHSFKLKTLAQDNGVDAARTAEVFQAARAWGQSPVLSIDSNEGNPDAVSVLDYLERLEALDPDAYAALSYLEQPTARDILASPQDWTAVSQRRPVMLDEGLTSLDLLPSVKEQHWTGLALKTCKGHSFTLIAAAWARENGLELSLQDLTNPGYSAIHSFLVGTHIATRNGVELNSFQYTPAANEPWLPALSGLFQPRNGVHRIDQTNITGLGSGLGNTSFL